MAGLVREIPFDDRGRSSSADDHRTYAIYIQHHQRHWRGLHYLRVHQTRSRKASEVHPLLYGVAVAFAIYFALVPIRSALGV